MAATITTILLLLAGASAAAAALDGPTLPSYTRFTFNASVFPPDAEYDYIIVGGGTAGCPLAATLSETHRVLLLERGGAPHEHPLLHHQDGFLSTLLAAPSTPDSPADPFVSDDGVPNARGRVLGGSSAINAGFYSRAHPAFYRSAGGGNWDMALVNQSYLWAEGAVTSVPDLRPFQTALLNALVEANVTPFNGYTVEHLAGTKIGASTFDSDGRRRSAADLLSLANPNNILVALRATVDRVILSEGGGGGRRRRGPQAAIGVVYRDQNGGYHRAMTRPLGEVVLCAGALGSPQLLLLSGLGPRVDLAKIGIPVALHHPDVGAYMFDNPRNGVSFIPGVPLNSSLIQVVGIPDADGDASFLEAASTVIPFQPAPRPPFFVPSNPIYVPVATIIEKVPGPTSFGFLRLASVDVRDTPRVRFNYLSSAVDLARCVAGVRRIGKVLAGRAMEGFRTHLPWWYAGRREGRQFQFQGTPLPDSRADDATFALFCRNTVSTLWHYHGGCVAGKVVDGKYRVLGVSALRVVDGSTFSVSPGTNPQATLMMMGRYVGRKMIEERRRAARKSPRPPQHS